MDEASGSIYLTLKVTATQGKVLARAKLRRFEGKRTYQLGFNT
jgi:hypothetical protein